MSRLAPLLLLFGLSALIFSGCEAFSSPQNTFAPEGTVAEDQKFYFLLVMWPALVIGVGVMLAIPLLAFRFRRKKGDPGLPKQIHGNTALELTWTIIPAIMMAAVAVPTVAGIQHLAERPGDDAFRIHVTGVQWAWQFEYPDLKDAEGQPLPPVFGELHIPVGRKVDVTIDSNDVNHSFWLPKLAGKTDAIQNHTNHMWLEANTPGVYQGQCAEFCGLDHQAMRFTATALDPAEFEAWLDEQGVTESRTPDEPPSDGAPTPDAADATPGEGGAPEDQATPSEEPEASNGE